MVTGAARRQQVFRGPRPFNPARDLKQVVNLLRIAFPEELGESEALWLQDLETLGTFMPLIWFLNHVNVMLGRLLYGFVWIEDGQIVGNVTISRLSPQNWLISNVAVHPDYRRRGIARGLMVASVDWIRDRAARWISLEVRRDNVTARSLYQNLGFVLVKGTTEMERYSNEPVRHSAPPEGYQLRPARSTDGSKIFELVRQVTPELVQRIAPIRRHDFQVGRVNRFIDGLHWVIGLPTNLRWVVTDADEQVVAALKVQVGGRQHRLLFLIHPDIPGLLEETLVTQALQVLSRQRGIIRATVDADQPATIAALQAYGFRQIRTLDRMVLELDGPRRIPLVSHQ
jgi:GNAT superfamily N-acetyltransferase